MNDLPLARSGDSDETSLNRPKPAEPPPPPPPPSARGLNRAAFALAHWQAPHWQWGPSLAVTRLLWSWRQLADY